MEPRCCVCQVDLPAPVVCTKCGEKCCGNCIREDDGACLTCLEQAFRIILNSLELTEVAAMNGDMDMGRPVEISLPAPRLQLRLLIGEQ